MPRKQAVQAKKNGKSLAAPRKMVKKQQPRKLTRAQLKKKNASIKQLQQQAQKEKQPQQLVQQEDQGSSSNSQEESKKRPRKSVNDQGDNQQSGGSQSDDQDDSEDSDQDESSEQILPQNLAVKNMNFRQKRGTKMNYLISRKKQQQEDPFWAQHANYFGGDLDGNDQQDQQDYVQSSSGRDFFDSDFGQTESQHNDDQNQAEKKEHDQEDEDKAKQRKKNIELMKKIKNAGENQSAPKNKGSKKSIQEQQVGNRYIHQLFTQEQLLGEAAHTQYFNWLSYRKLISLQTEKKDYAKKSHHVEGEKIIYRDKRGADGQRQVSYEICGKQQIKTIQDLRQAWKD